MDEPKEDLIFASNDPDCLDQIHMDSMSVSDVNLADILISKYDYLDSCISNETFDASLCSNLVMLLKFILENGIHLDEDINHREQMDMFFTLFRNILRNNLRCLPESINLLILRLIEIRASKWKLAGNIEEYYMNKVDQLSTTTNHNNSGGGAGAGGGGVGQPKNGRSINDKLMSCNNNGAALFRSFAVTDSGTEDTGNVPAFRTSRLLKTNSKGVLKDEVLIKNSDSGKVMGIKGRRVHMIEEMSDTIISFQKVSPSAKERMVQITGYCRENIEKAKNLIEVTIRQNISPIPMPMPMSLETSANNVANHHHHHHHHQNDCVVVDDDEIPFLMQNQCSNTTTSSNDPSTDHGSSHPYSFSLNALNKPVHIQVSDVAVGKKLQHFLNKFRFTDSLIVGNRNPEPSSSSSRIVYDRQFLINIKHSIKDQQVDPALIECIKLKQPNLLRRAAQENLEN